MRKLLAVCLFLFLGASAHAADYIGQYVPEARIVGTHRVKMAMWDVYNVTLYAPDGVYAPEKPFALSLTYHKSIPARTIANHAVTGMRDQGYDYEHKLAQWHERMVNIFPNVQPGTTLTGVTDGKGNVIFTKDKNIIGTIRDREFERYFFGIWLNSEVAKYLLGG